MQLGRHSKRAASCSLDGCQHPGEHRGMTIAAGKWDQLELAGHTCRLYVPPTPNQHNYVVIYLHCSEAVSLRGYLPFVEQFDRFGLRVIEPVTGRRWWTDRIWPEFDAAISTEAYVIKHVLPLVADRWNARPPQLALLGISMGGQGALRLAYKQPNIFPTVAAISPAVDFQKRIDEGI